MKQILLGQKERKAIRKLQVKSDFQLVSAELVKDWWVAEEFQRPVKKHREFEFFLKKSSIGRLQSGLFN